MIRFHFLLHLLFPSYSFLHHLVPASRIIISCLSPLSVFFSFHLFDSHLLSISLILSSPLTPLPLTSMPLSFPPLSLLYEVSPSSHRSFIIIPLSTFPLLSPLEITHPSPSPIFPLTVTFFLSLILTFDFPTKEIWVKYKECVRK